jgi:very-short-patch-repair endonuclease
MTSNRIRGTRPEIIAAARRLRQNLTPAEQKLWQALQNRQLGGLRFRSQHPVSSFILDFYCPERHLAIELDGEIHDHQHDYDNERTVQLNHLGYRVLRFRNEAVITDLENVLRQILEFSHVQNGQSKNTSTSEQISPLQSPPEWGI